MTLIADRGSVIQADLGAVVLGCVALLTALVIVKAFLVLRQTSWCEHHVHLAWCRMKAAGRVLRGRPAWACGLCGRPVAVEHAACRGCVLDLRDAYLSGERPYDWQEGGL